MEHDARQSEVVTVVLVEDHDTTRAGLARLLAGHGYRVLAASSFDEARGALASPGADLLITDVRLNGRNGIQLLASAPPGMGAVVLTGFDDPALAREAEQFGAAFLLKPCAPGALLQAIQAQLARPGRPRSNGPVRLWQRRAVPCRVPVQLAGEQGEIRDVSVGGAGFHSFTEPALDVVTTVHVSHQGSLLELPFRLRWRQSMQEGYWNCGGSIEASHRELWREITDGWR